MSHYRLSVIIALACLLTANGARSDERQQQVPATASSSPIGTTDNGRTLYLRECGICHLEGGTGTMMLARRLGEDKALLTQRDNLPPAYIEAAVRQGVNSMPTITRIEVSDEELRKIIHYLSGGRSSVSATAEPAGQTQP